MELFVSGRLCLFGEHSDWAGSYNRTNSEIEEGMAIVTGIEQGVYAKAERDSMFRFRTVLPSGTQTDWMEWPLSAKYLREVAKEGGFYSYVAGVAAFMLEYYDVGGISLDCYRVTMPIKKGLSSSAAICVLVARAFNQLYNLQISVRGEMEAAYRGEIMTPSRCGRLDQACAYGEKPVLMKFASENIEVERLGVGCDLYWVIADLHGEKDTRKILASLNACFPFAQNEVEENVQRALGPENRRIVTEVIAAMKEGDARKIGDLMNEAQRIFDKMVAPACPSELKAPLLHSIMEDETVRALSLGVKGVGSQGDGTVQMICDTPEKQRKLCAYLHEHLELESYAFTIRTQRSVRKAVIPIAGMGTRLFPATKAIKKELFPIVDYDGIIKPALLVQLEELDKSGIEEIALIIRPDEKEIFDKLFAKDAGTGVYQKLPGELREYNVRMNAIGQKITYIYQREQLGFGHAIYQARRFAGDDPVLMMLGDHIFHSAVSKTCAEQLIDVYERTGRLTLAIDEVELDRVMHYGILCGEFIDESERIIQVSAMTEKPTKDYAKTYLPVKDKKGTSRFYCVFGQYILTPRVFELLERNISQCDTTSGEIELTSVLFEIVQNEGMIGYRPEGERFDIGIPEAYRDTLSRFGRT